jgi:tetratricopeptide (TPR) repeat protein
MGTLRARGLLYSSLFLGSVACLAFAVYQQRYMHVVTAGHHAVTEQRFDDQDYERASHFWLAKRDALLFNRGVLAYKARNLPRAAEYFRLAMQGTTNPTLRMQANYNLGMVMLALEEVERAAEFFKEALRLNPHDTDTKFNLERLYHFVLRQEGDHGNAALKQAPGASEDKPDGGRGEGPGRSSPRPGL